LIKLLEYLALIVNQEFRKPNHVHEEDMGDFEMKIRFSLGGHPAKLRENQAIDNSASHRPSRVKLFKPADWCSGGLTDSNTR
jgi:hypothetical protein